MGRGGRAGGPRVADIVAAAGLSNAPFYRRFPSKDALVAALLEDGAERLASYVAHQMDKEPAPAEKVRCWVEGVLSQTREEIAATTLAVLWNGGSIARASPPAKGPPWPGSARSAGWLALRSGDGLRPGFQCRGPPRPG